MLSPPFTPRNQRHEPLPSLRQILRQPISLASITKPFQRCDSPTFELPIPIVARQYLQYPLRTSQLIIPLARSQLVRIQTRIGSEPLRFLLNHLCFSLVFGHKPANDPAFSLRIRHTNDYRLARPVCSSCLFQPLSPFILVIHITDQQNGVNNLKPVQNVQNRSSCRTCVCQAWLTIEVSLCSDSKRPRTMSNGSPRQLASRRIFPNPLSLRIEQPFFHPAYLCDQDAVGKVSGYGEVGTSFRHDNKLHVQFATPFSASQLSPNRLHNSPGAISAFHLSNCGLSSSRPQTEYPSLPSAINRICSGCS